MMSKQDLFGTDRLRGLSDKSLRKLHSGLIEEKKNLAKRSKQVASEINRRLTLENLQRKKAMLSSAERKALAQIMRPESIASSEAVGKLGKE